MLLKLLLTQIRFPDCLDQPAIVRQYMRRTAQISSGKNVNQVVMRALQT